MYQTQGMDFNDAGQQQSGELIPANTIAKVVATLRPGSTGQGGWLTRSNTSDVEYLNFEFTVLEGPFAKRKFWQNMTVSGGKVDERGQSKAWGITRRRCALCWTAPSALIPTTTVPPRARNASRKTSVHSMDCSLSPRLASKRVKTTIRTRTVWPSC